MLREIPSFSDHFKSTEVRIAYEGHRHANAPYRADRARRLHLVDMNISTRIILAIWYPVVDKQLTGYLRRSVLIDTSNRYVQSMLCPGI